MRNPLADLPAPSIPPKRRPGRPSNADRAAEARLAEQQAAAAAPAPAPEVRALPDDPELRRQALASVAGEVELALLLLDSLATRLPPRLPLDEKEREAIRAPLAECLWLWTGATSPEWRLVGALAGVAAVRYLVILAAQKAAAGGAVPAPPPPRSPASLATVEVAP